MGLSAAEIEAVVREIAPFLTGGWVQKIRQPTPRAITLQVRAPRQTLSLFISADSETARLHFLTQRQPNPAAPPPFCQFLRAHIQGARLDGIEQVQGDRIVRFRMTARRGTCSLIAQLTGKRADLLLLNAEDKILAALNRIFLRSCIPQTRTRESGEESLSESKCQIWSTRYAAILT